MEANPKPTAVLLDALRSTLLSDAEAGYFRDLGTQLHRAGQPEAALRSFERACERDPDSPGGWIAVASLRLQLQLPRLALEACNRALALAPNDINSLYSTAVVLTALGEYAPALHCYDRVLAMHAAHYGALRNRPMLLATMGRFHESRDAANQAIGAYPDDPWLHYNQGDLLLGMQAAEEAAMAFQQALALAPTFHQARYALAIALAAQGRVREAYVEREAALVSAPELVTTYKSPLIQDARYGTNEVSPERVAILAAFELVYRCNWSDYSSLCRLFTELVQGRHDNPPLDQQEMPYLALCLPVGEDIRRQVARQASARVLNAVREQRIFRPKRAPADQICIAYISAGFGPHPSAQLMGDIYARHDRSRFRVHAYAVGPSLDCPERDRVREGVDLFRDLERYPADAAAQLIANDGVDILIDLSGLTRGARPEILALRPAAIQVSYMDFIGTQGAPYIDYALLDREILDQYTRQFWDEKIAYLPACSYHCEMPPLVAPCTRADVGLPASGLVFGALHHPRKLDPECFSVWLDLLEEHPDSTLWLLYELDSQIENLRLAANARGIADIRLAFAPMASLAVHQARLRLADICLDTFVYNGHTTTVDVLGAGVPVVTLRGAGAVARVAASMLTAHGVPELIADSIDEYKAIVRRLASDPSWLEQVRERIANYGDSRLFCPEIRVRELETAFEIMWQRHQAGLPPSDFDVPEAVPSIAARS